MARSKEIVLGNVQSEVNRWQKILDTLKDLPDEMFDVILATNGSQQGLQAISPLLNGNSKKDYGDKKSFVKSIIASEKKGLRRNEIIKKYQEQRPGELKVASVVTNALTLLSGSGEIESYRPRNKKGRGSNWRIKAEG